MKKTDRATRNGKPIPPTVPASVGDVLWIMGTPFKLTEIVTAGRGSACRYFLFTDQRGHSIAVPQPKGASR